MPQPPPAWSGRAQARRIGWAVVARKDEALNFVARTDGISPKRRLAETLSKRSVGCGSGERVPLSKSLSSFTEPTGDSVLCHRRPRLLNPSTRTAGPVRDSVPPHQRPHGRYRQVQEGEGRRDAALEAVAGEVEQLEVGEGSRERVGDGADEGVGLEAKDAQLGERGEEGHGKDAGEVEVLKDELSDQGRGLGALAHAMPGGAEGGGGVAAPG
ncbi:hypothetical protein E2562_000178 [Oryza meyeriana var. granulata]|uniref:Uncharacterized protein n=1 Tax=Oryza meyeriana var. granulata TaxID=110450 RepID=A0A6G1DBS1_9ORYZ|nr:hypothetical protein E2562_000178 [Oryza meyeriana var. granulata]